MSSARFTPDGQSFVYSASFEGQPYGAFLGRPGSGDARNLQLKDSRILSVSRDGDMAVLFGPQSVERAIGLRTLARIPMAGGARRDVLTGVVAADFVPGTDTLAVIRDPGGGRPWTVEFPAGTTVHEAPAAWSLRVSPDGSRVAFFEGPLLFDSAPEAMITVIDKSGRKSTLATGLTGIGLAWAPSGNEIWFTATRPNRNAPHLLAVSLSGVERTVHRAPDWLVLHDISADGRVLLSRNTISINMACKPRQDAREHDLTWQMASTARALSTDGETVIFVDPLAPLSLWQVNNLSPKHGWVSGGPDWGRAAVELVAGRKMGGRRDRRESGPPADGRRFADHAPEGKPRAGPEARGGSPTRSALSSQAPRQTTRSEATFRRSRAAFLAPLHRKGWRSPPGRPCATTTFVLGRVGADTWKLFPILGGDGLAVPALTPRDMPVQWSQDGRYVYTVVNVGEIRPSSTDVFKVDIATGDRVLWKTLSPSDPVGVEDVRGSVIMTPDAEAYCYSYMRRLGDLFVVDGLK